jgi:hypothetical protein
MAVLGDGKPKLQIIDYHSRSGVESERTAAPTHGRLHLLVEQHLLQLCGR